MSHTINDNLAVERDPHELLHIFENAEDLPTLPEVAVRLQETVNDPRSGAKDVAKIIENDPAIATKVLRMVNSVFYAPAHGEEITQLTPAIARLGFLTVTNIALSTSVFQAFSPINNPAFNRRHFWKHSICVGIVTSILYDYCANSLTQRVSRDVAHLSGIVHDMGKILFERYANPEFHKAIESARQQDLPVIKEEARFIGMGHDEAGAWLAAKWHLGKEIQSVVRYHHNPLDCPDKDSHALLKLVHMADYICHMQGLGDSGNCNAFYDQHIREELNLNPDKIAEIMDMVELEAANSDILLSLSE
ncbi:MAG: HDOD domain-containing protein [Phycisphaerae bacterium]|nr:HDOD domain-containing protein [Phycisphaerae bacterium]